MFGLDFHVIPSFVYIAHFTKFTRGISAYGKAFACGQIKSGRKSLVKKKKKKKKTVLKKRERKNTFVKATGTDRAPR